MRDEQAHWEGRYRGPEKPPWDTGRPSAELLRALADEKPPPGRALELGCGTGTNTVWLAQQGFEVTAVDISPTALAEAEERARRAGVAVRFVAADVTKPLDLTGPFGFVFDRGCYHAVRRVDVDGFLANLERLTAPGSVALVLTGNDREARVPGPPAVSEATIRSELGRLFEVVWLREFRFDQDEPDGHRHLGWSCWLRRTR
jgi:methyl halide transferase